MSMFMRLVQVKVRPDMADALPLMYNERIIPALRSSPGCLYASLIRSVGNPEEAISMTLWDSQQHAEDYEQGGLFQKLLGEARPYLAETSEWKVQLSKDFTLQYQPVPEEPVVKSLHVTADSGSMLSAADRGRMYVRIVSVHLRPGAKEEFARLYAAEIIPTLLEVKGCRYAFLTEGLEERNEVLSISIWETADDATSYEQAGIFRHLQSKVEHTYSDLYLWKLAAEKKSGQAVSTTDDLHVKGYDVVTGGSF